MQTPQTRLPLAVVMPARWNMAGVSGIMQMLTPALIARLARLLSTALAAACIATKDEEQAVSTVTAGPRKRSVYETRPDTALSAVPVAE